MLRSIKAMMTLPRFAILRACEVLLRVKRHNNHSLLRLPCFCDISIVFVDFETLFSVSHFCQCFHSTSGFSFLAIVKTIGSLVPSSFSFGDVPHPPKIAAWQQSIKQVNLEQFSISISHLISNPRDESEQPILDQDWLKTDKTNNHKAQHLKDQKSRNTSDSRINIRLPTAANCMSLLLSISSISRNIHMSLQLSLPSLEVQLRVYDD